MKRILLLFALLLAVSAVAVEDKEGKARKEEVRKVREETRQLKGQMQTIYDAVTGNPKYQAQSTRAHHKADGSAKMVRGRSVVVLNTSIGQARQDMSFSNEDSYRATVWTNDTTNTFTYVTVNLSGKKFIVKSSDADDTSTVFYRVEGN